MLNDFRRLLGYTGKGLRFLLLLVLRSPFSALENLLSSWFLLKAFDALAGGQLPELRLYCWLYILAISLLFPAPAPAPRRLRPGKHCGMRRSAAGGKSPAAGLDAALCSGTDAFHTAAGCPAGGKAAKKVLEASAEAASALDPLITCGETSLLARQALGEGLGVLLGMGGYLVLLTVSGGLAAAGTSFGRLVEAFQLRGDVLMGVMMLTNSLINIYTTLPGIRRINRVLGEKSEA
ncbi:MAG: hypothetical protein PHD67_10705 [Oscillospiraceae bacterium]|nr:hypothetical protein [Oscillospiraceae bacterium]